MIEIKNLTTGELDGVVDLKIQCWTEELADRLENRLVHNEIKNKWLNWIDSAAEHEDIRIFAGAFEDGKLIGAVSASYADTYDIKNNGIELNGLWVFPEYRHKGVGTKLMMYVIDYFKDLGRDKIVIYSHHYAPSNQFFRKRGVKIIRKDKREDRKLIFDIFVANIDLFRANLLRSLGNCDNDIAV